MLARAVDEVDRDADLVDTAVAVPDALGETVRGFAVEVLRTVVREHPTPAHLREVVPGVVDRDEGLVRVAALLVLEAGSLRELHVPQVKGNEREEVQLPAGLQDGYRDLGDLREEILRGEAECGRPLHRLAGAHVSFGQERELDGAEKGVSALRVGVEESSEGGVTREKGH